MGPSYFLEFSHKLLLPRNGYSLDWLYMWMDYIYSSGPPPERLRRIASTPLLWSYLAEPDEFMRERIRAEIRLDLDEANMRFSVSSGPEASLVGISIFMAILQGYTEKFASALAPSSFMLPVIGRDRHDGSIQFAEMIYVTDKLALRGSDTLQLAILNQASIYERKKKDSPQGAI